MRDWPVVVTNRCAEACAAEFGLSHPGIAREWLYKVIDQRGRVANRLPPQAPKVASRSGYFLVADGVLVLPLTAASDGTARWIATGCALFPSYRRSHGGTASVDPFNLAGPALVRHIHLTREAVEQFQRHCGGDPNPEIARHDLLEILSRHARAVRERPTWCRASGADFYVVSSDEYVLAMSRKGGGHYAFDAVGCVHRAADLLALRGAGLTARLRFDAGTLGVEPERWDGFVTAVTEGGFLSWHRPRWTRDHPTARFWVVASPSLAAPAAWHPRNDRPLLILDIRQRRSMADRVGRWFNPAHGRPGSRRRTG